MTTSVSIALKMATLLCRSLLWLAIVLVSPPPSQRAPAPAPAACAHSLSYTRASVQGSVAAFVQQGKTHCTARGGRPRHCARGVDTLRGLRPVEPARRPPPPPRAPPALLMTEEVTGVVISEACEEDIAAIAQLSMDAFYGRPWKMGRALPWIASEKTGLDGVLEKIQLLLAQYQSPPGDHYVGYEYVWTRKQVSAPSASDLSCTICSRRCRAAAMRFSREATARAPTLHISVVLSLCKIRNRSG
jgi:hypothetical protein